MSLEIAKCPQGAKSLNTLALVLILLLWPPLLLTWHHWPWMWEKMCTVSQTRESHQHTTVWEHACTVVTPLPYLNNEVSRQDFTWFKSYPFPTEMNLLANFFFQEVAWILPHKIMSRKAWLRLFWNRKYPKQMLTVTPRLIKNSLNISLNHVTSQ